MYTIVTDNQVTRNRKVHYVFDGLDTLVFSAPTLKDCLEYLAENSIPEFYIDYGEYRARLHLAQKSHGVDVTLMGWLHRTPEAKSEDGASPQAAPRPKK